MTRPHQYIDRATGKVMDEKLFGDSLIRLLYSPLRENAPKLFSLLISARVSQLLAFANYDVPRTCMRKHFLPPGFDLSECLESSTVMRSHREFFERKIKYWECRPLEGDVESIVSPSDARVFLGSLCDHSLLFIKRKLFDIRELLGFEKETWVNAFQNGDFAVFRLTPDKYHYNHAPVSGLVVDFYAVEGSYHSCNPSAVIAIADTYSKNKRVVTIIDTDVPNGTRAGLVAMVEVVALMIGDIVQCYSRCRYESPTPVKKGVFLEIGCPKSLFRPGSSTVILLFESRRIQFSSDLLNNLNRQDVHSRLSDGVSGTTVVETEVRVRSEIARVLK